MPGAGSASSAAVRRLRRDLESLERSRHPQIAVRPSEDDLLELHFVLHSLPADTPYHGGCYHGKLIFPPDYPHAPPGIVMVTPSGRLATGTRLCLSMTDYHPESWSPAWSVETILVGLLSFFVSDAEMGYGAVAQPVASRRELARASWEANARDPEFVALFPGLLAPGLGGACAATAAPTRAPRPAAVPLPPGAAVAASALAGGADAAGGALAAAAEPLLGGAEEPQGEGDDVPRECWICRDASSAEALVRPCACSGSTGEVHASCVEQWVRRHRQSAVNDEAPRCPVCKQEYRGLEQRPGVNVFVRYACWCACQLALRLVMVLLLMAGYEDVASGSVDVPLKGRMLFGSLFALIMVHKLVVLTVSMPGRGPPPQRELVRRWFSVRGWRLMLHAAEAGAIVSVMARCSGYGTLPLVFFLVASIAAALPICKMCTRPPSADCARRVLSGIAILLLSPLLLVFAMAAAVWKYPRRVVHPLDAGVHIVVALVAVPLCFLPGPDAPVILLWKFHSALVAAGIAEVLLVRRLRWHPGGLWLAALLLSELSVTIANAREFSQGVKVSSETREAVGFVSGVWLLLVASLALSVNWSSCLWVYHVWQNRNGTFALQLPAQQGDPTLDP